MSDLFSAGKPSSVRRKADVLKSTLKFGEVATGLGLSGSSRRGWDCPCCGAEFSIRETEDHQGGRCKSCGEGFDIIKLVREAEHLPFQKSLERLSDIRSERDDKSKTRKLL